MLSVQDDVSTHTEIVEHNSCNGVVAGYDWTIGDRTMNRSLNRPDLNRPVENAIPVQSMRHAVNHC